MLEERTCPGFCPVWNWLPAGLKSLFPAGVLSVRFHKCLYKRHTSASLPLAVENLLVCLNLEKPKADVPLFVKNPFLKSDAWEIFCPLQMHSYYHRDWEYITCNLWRATIFFFAIFDAVRISEALMYRILRIVNNLWFTRYVMSSNLIFGITTFGGFGGQIMLLGHPFCHGSSSTSGSLLYDQCHKMLLSIMVRWPTLLVVRWSNDIVLPVT